MTDTLDRTTSLTCDDLFPCCEVFPMGTEVTAPPNQLAAFVEAGVDRTVDAKGNFQALQELRTKHPISLLISPVQSLLSPEFGMPYTEVRHVKSQSPYIQALQPTGCEDIRWGFEGQDGANIKPEVVAIVLALTHANF